MVSCLHCISLSLEFPSQNFLCIYPSVRQESQIKKSSLTEKPLELTVKDFRQLVFLLRWVRLARC